MRGERDCVGVVLAESSRLLTTSQEEVAPCAPSAWTSIAPSPRWWRGATGWSPGWAGSTCGRDWLEAFARLTLRHDHHVVVEATGNAAAVVEVLSAHVGRVVIANPKQVRVIADANINTDTIGATVLAKLSASGFLPEVWMPDARTEAMRRQVTRRTQLVAREKRRTPRNALAFWDLQVFAFARLLPELVLDVIGHEGAAPTPRRRRRRDPGMIMARRQAAGGAGGKVAELLADRHAQRLGGLEAGAVLRHMPAEEFGVPVLRDAEQPDLAVLDGW
jgi:hypothetical protein